MCPNPQFPADLVAFTEETLNGKLQFLCSERSGSVLSYLDQIHALFCGRLPTG